MTDYTTLIPKFFIFSETCRKAFKTLIIENLENFKRARALILFKKLKFLVWTWDKIEGIYYEIIFKIYYFEIFMVKLSFRHIGQIQKYTLVFFFVLKSQ